MNKKFLCLLSVLFIIFTISSCNLEPAEKVDLTKGWSYSITDPSSEDAKFIPLPKKTMEDLSSVIPEKKGFIWLQKSFLIPASFKGRDLLCYLGRITMADQTWINGFYIGGEGKFPPQEFSAWNVARQYPVSKEFLQDGPNTILVKIWCDGEASIVSSPYIGLVSDARFSAEWENFWTSRLYLVFAFCSLVIGLYHLIIYFKRRIERENLTFGLVNIISFLYLSVLYIYEIPGMPASWIDFLIFQKIFSAGLPFLLAFLVTSYIYNFIKVKEKGVVFFIRFLLTAAPVVYTSISPDYPTLHARMPVVFLCLLVLLAYMLFVIVFNFPKHKKHTLYLFTGFLPVIAAVTADIVIHNYLHRFHVIYFTGIGWMGTLLVLLYIMARRFARARNNAEYLNANLKEEVSARTAELTKSTRILEEAAKKSEQEIKLAGNVQQAFFQTDISNLDDWEAALYFKPQSGVSGDLYEFFIDNKTLKGAGLFDVSGKGISAALVTMLAKSIIDKKFREGSMQNLGKVMATISTAIAKEKGSIENFLTGTLVRIDGNRVEFVNAGQPKAFFRKASGQIASIQSATSEADQEIKLGYSVLPPECKTIGFSAQPKDSLILYTSSFVKAKNSFGVEFGSDRISRAFAGAGNGSAQEKLNVILDIFNLYITDVPLEDDLTIIVLQKK